MAWRCSETDFLQSSLTRLLALSLLCTLASAALFQPALMGSPRGAHLDRSPG
jgi:hypothetical protein